MTGQASSPFLTHLPGAMIQKQPHSTTMCCGRMESHVSDCFIYWISPCLRTFTHLPAMCAETLLSYMASQLTPGR